ncbi:MAG: malto-oligosyltrehalose synthase [Chitinophagaceae bacterium]|nr:malto-oligosyltrehalose synthase [Chitinophagaceae bacterium]
MKIPSSTYRLQFHHGFTFKHLNELIDYLEDLGITAVYASPIFAAVKGSEHGYDGIDPRRLNAEIGTMEELSSVSSLLRSRGIGWIQDIVPNHLAFHTDNSWLFDVFERGISSSYAHYFDIDWDHPFYTHKLIAPVLGQDLDACINEKQIELELNPSGFSLKYFNYNFPVKMEDYPVLLEDCLSEKHANLITALNELISNTDCTHNEWLENKRDLTELLHSPNLLDAISTRLKAIMQDKELFTELINQQHYVLCKYSVTDKQLNYRRFFNINALISLRMEDEQVFNDCHQFVYELYKQGIITGLRIDHIDGLKDPVEYIDRLRQLFGEDCYIIVEKILDIKEQLPPMDIQGTSGYEFLSYTNQLITDTQGADKLLSIYQQYVPQEKDYHRTVYDNKLSNLENSLSGDWDNLLRMILSLQLIKDQEIELQKLKHALGVFMAAYPVYRSYDTSFPLSIESQQQLSDAFGTALKYEPSHEQELHLIQQIFQPGADAAETAKHLAVMQRIMQYTGPMAAKGVEDTTFYQYNALISHNEVGDAPCVLGISVKAFHEKMQQRIQYNACSMNSTSTHDTKRGEDARMRINLLSELTDDWNQLVWECRKLAEPSRVQLDGKPAPSLNDEYFLYQTIIGSLPDDLIATEEYINRAKDYLIKALRESKLNSNHVSPNDAYEKACLNFIEELLDPEKGFLPLFTAFVKRILPWSRVYSLAQLIIKLTAPGIPDIYRGCELWDYSFVDPDNRRPVDYEIRKKLVAQLKDSGDEMVQHSSDIMSPDHQLGIHKLWITRKLLFLRKEQPLLFSKGEYIPIYAQDNDRNVIAYFRRHEKEWLLVILPLGIVSGEHLSLMIKLPENAPSRWQNIFTGKEVNGATMNTTELYRNYPVAVLRANISAV